MTRRRYISQVIEIVYPDGRQIGFMIHAGSWWFGPYMTSDGWNMRFDGSRLT